MGQDSSNNPFSPPDNKGKDIICYMTKKKSVCHVTEFLKMPYLFFVFLLLEAQKPQVVTAKRSYLVVGKAILQDLFEEFRLRAFLVVILHECTG